MASLIRPWLGGVVCMAAGAWACGSNSAADQKSTAGGGAASTGHDVHMATDDDSSSSGGQTSGESTKTSDAPDDSSSGGTARATEDTTGSADAGDDTATTAGEGTGDADPSLGCGQDEGMSSGRFAIDVDGTEREYIISIPPSYDPDHPYRLVFGFHGAKYDAQWVAGGEEPLTGPYFGLESEANGSAIFVAGQALSTSWTNEGGRDIAYVQAMLDEFRSTLCIDQNRIFATGFSFGAIMTNRIGCELTETFRAVAPMSSSLPDSCTDSLPAIAYFGSHGTQDGTIQLPLGEAVRDSYRARNHCAAQASSPNENNCISYEDCDDGAPVVWCTFEGEHEPAPIAGKEIWAFFSQF